jgi:N-formylmaleamate deformylase
MAAWQEGTVDANGIRLHYRRTGGNKTPMILAHGLTGVSSSWSRLARVLEPTYDLIMVDARGHGLSDKPETGYTAEDNMKDLVGVIEALKLDRPIVIGHSMGAFTAGLVSAEYPDLVRAAILEDPVWRWPASPDGTPPDRQGFYENWRARLEDSKSLTTEKRYARTRRERPLWAAEDHDAYVQAIEQVSVQALDFILNETPSWLQQVPKITVPTLLIYGNQALGSIVGPDVAAEAHRLNPLIEPVQIPTAGHSIRAERFEEYFAALREFLARALRRSAIMARP